MSKRKARPGDTIVIIGTPDNGRPANVVQTEDGYRVLARVIETNNLDWFGADQWRHLDGAE